MLELGKYIKELIEAKKKNRKPKHVRELLTGG